MADNEHKRPSISQSQVESEILQLVFETNNAKQGQQQQLGDSSQVAN